MGKKHGRACSAPKFDLRTQLFQMCGVDLTRIDITTSLSVVSKIVQAEVLGHPRIVHVAVAD